MSKFFQTFFPQILDDPRDVDIYISAIHDIFGSMACDHLDQLRSLSSPSGQLVHREECTLCFDGQVMSITNPATPLDNSDLIKDFPTGIDVCLTCFNGGCRNAERRHIFLHFEKYNHPFTLNVKRKLKSNAVHVCNLFSISPNAFLI